MRRLRWVRAAVGLGWLLGSTPAWAGPASVEPADPLEPLQQISIGPDTWLSIGGQVRVRAESRRNPALGRTELRTHDVQLYRGLLHLELRDGGGQRAFLQLGTALAVGGEVPVRAIDQDVLSVRQAFTDAELARGRLRLRLGRQEAPLGSGRLVALRDGPNVRLSFDGARLTLRHGRGTVDALGLLTVAVRHGVLDDLPDPSQALWGLYSTTDVVDDARLSIDAYYLGLRREESSFGADTGVQVRHSFGSRVFGVLGPYDYNVEVIGQAGRFAGRPIAAWTVASDQGVTARLPGLEPRLGLRANVTSGGSSGTGPLRTFDALYPNLAYFSQFALLSPSNHVDLHPRLTIDVLERLELEAAGDWFWRTSRQDVIYEPPGVPVGVLEDYEGRFVGVEATLSVQARLSPRATVTAYLSQLWAGEVLRSLGGRDARFVGTWLTWVL